MSEVIFVVEHAPEGGYTARALGEAIFTQAETIPELHAGVREAVQCHFDDARRCTTRARRSTGSALPSATPPWLM